MNGGIAFKCIACKHTVNTLEFDSVNGNLRTQAAAAMNQHVVDLHLPRQTPFTAGLGSRGAL
ncbi:MAG TPA: hypothetical protein VLV49_04080 [Terriglobales bacterium]|nr:hypothetical protein [Terriglobales bacterium]